MRVFRIDMEKPIMQKVFIFMSFVQMCTHDEKFVYKSKTTISMNVCLNYLDVQFSTDVEDVVKSWTCESKIIHFFHYYYCFPCTPRGNIANNNNFHFQCLHWNKNYVLSIQTTQTFVAWNELGF